MKLFDLTELSVNNRECVVLKVKEGHELDLISMGCFDGNETMFRLTKGRTIVCTVFKRGAQPFSWHWGDSGYTLVSPKVEMMGRMIQNCIERDYRIKCKE